MKLDLEEAMLTGIALKLCGNDEAGLVYPDGSHTFSGYCRDRGCSKCIFGVGHSKEGVANHPKELMKFLQDNRDTIEFIK